MADKMQKVRQLKDDQIRAEIIKIGEKDSEARKLEKKEQKILKRLKQTHERQQEAIEEIQQIFSNQNSSRLRIMDDPALNSGRGSMPGQQYQPLSEEAAGILSSDDDGQTLSKNQMQPMQTGVPTLGNTTENPSGALIQSSTEPTNLELPVNQQQRELVTPDQNLEKSPAAAGMT